MRSWYTIYIYRDVHTLEPSSPNSVDTDTQDKLIRKHLVIYTDGSCPENSLPAHLRTSAGWGFVALDGFTFMNSQAGPVIKDPTSPGHMGAEEFSNNSGELSALHGALTIQNIT